MDKQAIFDRVAKHLIRQNAKCMSDLGTCVLRNHEAQACAVGCLIPSHQYREWMEEHDIEELIQMGVFSDIPESHADEAGEFLAELQYIHDYKSPVHWPEELAHFAKKKGLNLNLGQKEIAA